MRWTLGRSLVAALLLLGGSYGCNRDGRHPPASDGAPRREGPENADQDDEDDVAQPSRHLGEMMAEIGRRLERSGRSVQAGRWELAAYDIEELEEVFEDELALFVSADDALDIGKVAALFARTHLPTLEQAITARDRTAFERAFATTTEGCNSCHRAANHPYIEVPSGIGEPIPRLTPVDAAAPATPVATPRPGDAGL